MATRQSSPALFPQADDPNKAKLEDIWQPLNEVLKDIPNGRSVILEFFFDHSKIIHGERKVACYERGKGGNKLIVGEDGTCYVEEETGLYAPITRQAALAKWPDLLVIAVPEDKQQPKSQDDKPDTVDAEFQDIPPEPQPYHPPLPEPVGLDQGLSPDQRMALRSPGLAGNIDSLSMIPERAAEILNARIDILNRMRTASIRQTFPTDWLLFLNQTTNQAMAYLQDSGCERIAKLWGIKVFNVSNFEKITAEDGSYAYVITGDARSGFTGEEVEAIEGIRSSDDGFFRSNGVKGARLEYYVRKAARANLDGSALRTLSGLGNVPIEALKACGLDTEKCNKGKGYGSGAERSGADVTLKDAGIPASQFPKCDKCGGEMKFIAGRNDEQKQYEAFFACKKPKGQCSGKGVTAAGWIAKVKQSQSKAESDTAPAEQNDSGWKCGKAKQGTIQNMRKMLTEKHRWAIAQFESNLLDLVRSTPLLFPQSNITIESLNDEQAAKYIAHLSETINRLAK